MKIAILSDIHFGVRSDSEVFRDKFQEFVDTIFLPYLKEHDIKVLWILGDIFERRKFVDFRTLQFAEKFFTTLQNLNINTYIAVGNHDIYFKNTVKLSSVSLLLKNYSNVQFDIHPKEFTFGGKNVLFVPWICEENEQECLEAIKNTDAEICCGHFELYGFQFNKFTVSQSGQDPSFLKKFKLVLSGHYHIKSENGNVVYVGSPIQTGWNDYGVKKGFHVLDIDTHELEFIEGIDDTFVVLQADESIPNNLKNKFIRLVIDDDNVDSEKIINEITAQQPCDLKCVGLNVLRTEQVEELDNVRCIDTKMVLLDNVKKYLSEGMDEEKMKTIIENLFNESDNLD